MRWSPAMTLVALYDRIFLLGQSFMPAVYDLLLGFLLYQSRLVPRGLSLIGIIGAPLLLAGYLAVMFGLIGQHAPVAGLSALPVALFEFSLGVWLVVKGFKPSAILSSDLFSSGFGTRLPLRGTAKSFHTDEVFGREAALNSWC